MPHSNFLHALSSSTTSARPAFSSHFQAKWGWIAAALSALTLTTAAGCDGDDGSSSSTDGTSSSSSSSSGSSSGGGSGGAGTGGGGGAAPIECNPTKDPGPANDVAVTSAEATVVDLMNNPVKDNIVQLCGLNLCLNGTTGADGHVIVQAGNKMLTNPAFKYGDGFLYGKFAVPLKDAVTALGTVVTAALPASGEAMVPGKAVISGGVTLTIPAGAGVNVDVLTYDTPDKQVFKAASVPVDKALPSLDPTLGLKALYVVAPVDTVFCPPATVMVDNAAALPAGSAVEFWIHGVGVEEYYVPYGGWAKISDGTVSADGKTISTSPGGGLPILTVFGVRAKP